MELSALDVNYVVKELQDLVEGKVSKIYQPSNKEFIFVIHKDGKKILNLVKGEGLFLSEQKEEQKNPKSFCLFLRKRLMQSRVKEIKQKGFERIIEIVFRGLDQDYILVVELFSKGNVVLCDENYKILMPLEKQEWKDRIVERGAIYKFPPERLNLFEVTFEQFNDILKKSERQNIVKKLAVDLGLGGKYAEKVCEDLKLDKEIKDLRDNKAKEAFRYIKDLLNKKPDVSEDLAEQYSKEKEPVFDSEKEKIRDVIKNQEERLKELEKYAVDYKEIGDLIYKNFNIIEDVLKEIKEKKWKVKNKFINELKPSEGKVVLELE